MFGHSVWCVICVGPDRNLACGEEDRFDDGPPDDKLCRDCRKAVKDATEQRQKQLNERK